jgi:UDP-N-acetylglucosamine 1-carboxyvinyltransferase
VQTLLKVLAHMGAKTEQHTDAALPNLSIDAGPVRNPEAPYELVRTMRAAILVLGPLLARFGTARVSLPGGCAIGARPIDQHLKGLVRLGATIDIEHGYVQARAKRGLVGCEFTFDVPTVTGTENLMLAASLARGPSLLRNAAREPEIIDLARALQQMGATVEGAGTDQIRLGGLPADAPLGTTLSPYVYRVAPDRIELGTWLIAGALAGDGLEVRGGNPQQHSALIDKLRSAGASVEVDPYTQICRLQRALRPRSVDIKTASYPGFPTDMQAQWMALMAIGQQTSVVTETIFENRFMHVAELDRMGAHIRVEGNQAIVKGVGQLSGTTVMATDLRASACLVLAALVADGQSVVRRIYHLDRGYAHLERKLRKVGGCIERFTEHPEAERSLGRLG